MGQRNVQESDIEKTSELTGVSQQLVELIISHKTRAMYEALSLYQSVEDSGLGKFSIRSKNVRKRIAKLEAWMTWIEKELEKEDLTDMQRGKLTTKMLEHIEEKQYLESKI